MPDACAGSRRLDQAKSAANRLSKRRSYADKCGPVLFKQDPIWSLNR